MGIRYSTYIDSEKTQATTFGCSGCRTHLSTSGLILSKDYRGHTGDAYLMDQVVNVTLGRREFRTMITGRYLVSDIMCHQCGHRVGWKYHQTDEKNQKFKEGRYILEVNTIVKCK
ncbi:MOH1 [Cyberlindnera jadinii]|uniref:Protein yippee-like n=1 Tax=Cyberlindnera jadinii (strain ATCC 18201 / CBS 1600 / BCRC 20928 / JCM 3617 / NBRC 0987 / NRRL Y-1542) TaxID=983966 RepID=A0A0H5C9Y1_CYBJN|nr:yippee-like protein [Cyberlindnera jadinii NRRL Y-1542]ODV71524.1 yippee-like protein [Cyberlindnera jadinii NRRL Y-1542]CEP25246.1 MOH1 [Cyberlindnera jadinii]